MDFEGENEPEPSRFQKYSKMVNKFLENIQPPATIFKHQSDALLAVKRYFSGNQIPDRPALIVAPTGAGKSGMVALMPYVLASAKVMILSPSLTISNQLEKDFGLHNADVNESFACKTKAVPENRIKDFLEFNGKKVDVTKCIQNMDVYNLVIVNAQKFSANSSASLREPEADDGEMPDSSGSLEESETDDEEADNEEVFRQELRQRKKCFEKFTTLIVDEAHHFPAETWDLICKEFRGKQIIFLTATPFRGKGREPLWNNQEPTYQIRRKALIRLNIIRNLIYRDIDCEATDYDGIRRFILNTLELHDQKEPAVKHRAIVLTQYTNEAEEAARYMEGHATFYISGNKTRAERNLKKFSKDPQCRIIFVCGRLLEGYDNPDISVAVILRKVGVLGLFTQFVGRCIRTSRGLPDNRIDSVTAVVASHPQFNQEPNFNDYIRN